MNTKEMIADLLTKPIQGAKFIHLRELIMGELWAKAKSQSLWGSDEMIINYQISVMVMFYLPIFIVVLYNRQLPWLTKIFWSKPNQTIVAMLCEE